LAFDVDGNLYVACYRPDRIYRVDRDGRAEVLADDPEGTQLSAPTNVVFAGRGLDHLVIASIGRWHLTIADVGAIGAPLHYPTVPSWSG
jgi:gluconolactonase